MHVDQVRQRCTFLTVFGLQHDWLRYALLTPITSAVAGYYSTERIS